MHVEYLLLHVLVIQVIYMLELVRFHIRQKKLFKKHTRANISVIIIGITEKLHFGEKSYDGTAIDLKFICKHKPEHLLRFIVIHTF